MNMKQVLACAMDIGECMLISGAGVSRVEDTIWRICRAYGAKKTHVFSITSSIITSVENENGEILTQTKRIRNYKTDFHKLDELNTLSRYMCRELPDWEVVQKEIQRIQKESSGNIEKQIFVSAMIAGAFAVFFGGGWQEGLIALFTGGLVTIFMISMGKFTNNLMFLDFISAFFVASAAYLMAKIGFAPDYGKVIIGNIMLLVPGVAFVNSLRDMIGGDMMSGILKVCESVLLAVFLAGGSFAAIVFWGGVL